MSKSKIQKQSKPNQTKTNHSFPKLSFEDKVKNSIRPKEEIVNLNVGGKKFITSKLTLTKSPYFEYIFNNNIKSQLEDHTYFIDRPAEYFEEILHFLQTVSKRHFFKIT